MIQIEIDSQAVTDALNRLLDRGEHMRPLMEAIGQRMEERVASRFESKTDPNGQAWAPWKPSTIKSYPKNGNHTLLDRFGDMLASLNHQSGDDYVEIGFGVDYAQYHEFGTSKMARRGMLTADPVARTLGAEDERSIVDLVTGYLQE